MLSGAFCRLSLMHCFGVCVFVEGNRETKELGQEAFAFLLMDASPRCLAEQWQAQLGGGGKAEKMILASN